MNPTLYVFQGEDLKLIITPDNGEGLPLLTCVMEEAINKGTILTFSVPSTHEQSQLVQSGDLVVVELNDEVVEDIRPQNTTAKDALNRILANTRWQVGHVDALGSNSTNVYYVSVMEGIQRVVETWGGELQFRVMMDTLRNKITGRYVDLLAQIGHMTGKRFQYGKDMKTVERTIDTKSMKTALFGRGKGEETDSGGYGRRITFADIAWSKANGDPADKPAGQEWIGDSDALETWGHLNSDGTKRHRMGVYINEEQTDPVKLLQETWDQLQQLKQPQVTYKMDVMDLEQVPTNEYKHEAIRLGDTVFVIDRHFSIQIEISARVIEITRDLIAPENTKITLGHPQQDISGLIRRLQNQVKNKVSRGDPIGWLEGVIDAERTEFEARSAFVYINNTDGILITNRPKDSIDNPPNQAIQLKAGALAIANSKNPQGDWEWRTFITGEHVIADAISAGRIRTDSVEIGDDEGRVSIRGGDVILRGGSLQVYSSMDESEEGAMISGNKVQTNFLWNADFVQQPSGDPLIDWELTSGVANWNSNGYITINGVNTVGYWAGINQWVDVYHPQVTLQAYFEVPFGSATPKNLRFYIYCYDENGTKLADQFRTETTAIYTNKYLFTYRLNFTPGTKRARIFFQVNYERNLTNAFKLHWVRAYYDDYLLASAMNMIPQDVYNIQAVPECQLISVNVPFSGTLTANTVYLAGDVLFDRPFKVSGTPGTDYQIICNLSPVDYPDYHCVAAYPSYSGFNLRIMPIKNISTTTSRTELKMRGFAYKANYPANVWTAPIQ